MSMLYRFLLSFLAVALIPLITVSVFFYQHNLSGVRENIERLNLYQLKQIQNVYEQQFEQHLLCVEKISAEPKLNGSRLRGSQFQRLEAIEAFRMHTLNYNFAEQAYLYLHDEDIVYTGSGVMSYDAMTSRQYLFTQTEKAIFREWIVEAKSASARTMGMAFAMGGERTEKTIYQYPLSVGKTTLFFIVDTSEMMGLFRQMENEMGGYALVMDRQGNVVMDTVQDAATRAAIISAIGESDMEKTRGLELNGERYSLLATRSSSSGSTYAVVMPDSVYSLNHMRDANLIMQISISLLLVCILVSIMLAITHYKPLRHVMQSIGADDSVRGNEYDRIRQSFEGGEEQRKQLRRIVDIQAPYAKDRVLELLLFSDIRALEFEALKRDMEQGFQMPCYFAMALEIFSRGNGHHAAQFREIANACADGLSGKFGAPVALRCVEVAGENRITLIVNIENPDQKGFVVSRYLDELSAVQSIDPNASILYGCGNVCDSMWGLRQSAHEANAVIDHNRMRGGTPIVNFDEIPQDIGKFDYPTALHMLFLQQLKSGDSDGAQKTLGDLCKSAAFRQKSAFVQKYICSDIINSLIKEVNELYPGEMREEISELIAFRDIVDFEQRMNALTANLCVLINRSKKSNSILLKEKILDYIANNYHDPDLGLNDIGDQFDLSPSYVSRFIREQTNLNIKDVISRVRIEEANRLLRDTDLPVNEIVERVGYYSASSFIRKYRSIMGMTPGDYRLQERQ